MTIDIEALKAVAEKAKAQGWRVRTNRHTATNGDEWGWLSDQDDRSNYMGGLKITWEGKAAQETARFVVNAPQTILSLIARTEAAEGEVKRLKKTRWSARVHAAAEARIAELVAQRDGLVEALTEIARLRTELSGDFSMGGKQSDIARAALSTIKAGGGEDQDMASRSQPSGSQDDLSAPATAPLASDAQTNGDGQ